MPETRRATYRRRRILVFGLLTVLLTSGGYAAATGLTPVPAAAATLTQPADATPPAAVLDWPEFGGSAVGAVGFPGLLASDGTQTAVPMASLTKMVVALVVLDVHPLGEADEGPDITFTAQDVANYQEAIVTGGSFAPVMDGLVLSQRQALTAMLLPSANNYAQSLAVWAYGSAEQYLAAAEVWLAEHGLSDTVVADLSGLSAQSMSTPANLVEIGKLVAADPTLAAIVAMPTATLPGAGIVTNTNQLLGSYGIDGIKTGTTFAAGACLLFSTDLTIGDETVTVIGVVLTGDNQIEVRAAVTALIDTVKAGFHDVQLTDAGTEYGRYSTDWGQSSSLVAAEAASVLVWSDTPVSGVAEAEPAAIGTAGDTVGSVDFLVGGETISVPLELTETLSDPGPGWRLSHPAELFGW